MYLYNGTDSSYFPLPLPLPIPDARLRVRVLPPLPPRRLPEVPGILPGAVGRAGDREGPRGPTRQAGSLGLISAAAASLHLRSLQRDGVPAQARGRQVCQKKLSRLAACKIAS